MQHFPLRSSGRRILNYLDDWLILARSLDTLISHIDSLLFTWSPYGYESPSLARSRGGWDPASREIAWDESLPLVRSRGDESRLSRDRAAANCLPCTFSGRAALFSWGYYRDCSYSRWWIQRYYIRYYTCARCSYGWNLEFRERRGLREVCASRPHRSSDATQMRQMITMDASAHGWGVVCEGMPASGL